MNDLQLYCWQFSHKETLRKTFFKWSAFFLRKSAVLCFWDPLGDLGATYDNHLRLIGKRVVDFLLALIELFSLGVTAEELRAIIGWKSASSLQWGPVDQKFHVEGVAPHQPFFFSENEAKCSFVRYINLDRSFYRFVTIHACDRRTDRWTDGQTDGQNSHR